MLFILHLPLLVGSFALLCVVHCTASDTGIMNAVMDNSNTTPGHTTRPIRTNTRASVTLKPPPIIKPSANVKPSKPIKPNTTSNVTPMPSIAPKATVAPEPSTVHMPRIEPDRSIVWTSDMTPPIFKPSANVKPSKPIKPSGHVVPSVSIKPTPSIIPKHSIAPTEPSTHVPSKTIKPSGHVVPSVSITPTPSIIPDTPIPSSAVTVTMVVNASFHESEIRAEIDTLFNDTVSLIRLTCEARPASENSSCIGIFVNRAAANFMVSAVYDSKLSGIYSAEVKLPPVPPVTPTDETFKGKSVIILASVAGGIALIAIIVGLVFYFRKKEYGDVPDIPLRSMNTDDHIQYNDDRQ